MADEESPQPPSEPSTEPDPQAGEPPAALARSFRPRKPFPWTAAGTVAALLVSIASAIFSQQSVEQARRSADIAEKSLEFSRLDQRPWLKVAHRIIKPLTFNVGGRASDKDVAMLVLEKTVENVGKGVAINVFSWEDVVPIDLDHSPRSALARQEEWCGDNRFPDPKGLSGYMLFPGETMTVSAQMGPTMERVAEFTHSQGGLSGKAAFMVVGCVCYKSTFESDSIPTHQTRFAYYLAAPAEEGGVNPYVLPEGVADRLRLTSFPLGFSAD